VLDVRDRKVDRKMLDRDGISAGDIAARYLTAIEKVTAAVDAAMS